MCLSSPADFAGHASLHLDDVGGGGEPQAAEDALAALEFVHLQHGARPLQLPLCRLDVSRNLGRRGEKNRDVIGGGGVQTFTKGL